jgi:hypothetical protein
MGFVSSENRCFNSKPPRSPDLSHQESYCLDEAFSRCEVHRAAVKVPMPATIGTSRAGSSAPGRLFLMIFALLTVVIAALMYFTGWKNLKSSLFPASANGMREDPPPVLVTSTVTDAGAAVSETLTPTFDLGPLATETPVSEWSALVTFTPLPENTSALLPSQHGFEIIKMPAGSTQGYLVHIVMAGETLDVIADRYSTTVQAIIAVNYELKPPVWAQYPIVIPIGAQVATGSPAFDVYVVETDETVTSGSLAETLGVDKTALQYYNLCSDDCQFTRGDVLLIPYLQ